MYPKLAPNRTAKTEREEDERQPVPEGSAIIWAVFIVNKQWSKVKESIEKNQDDALIIEGYPIVGKGGVAAVMSTNYKSVMMERAQREGEKA